MPTAFLSISFAHKDAFTAEIASIRDALAQYGVALFVFVEAYQFTAEQAAEMMQTAVAELRKADFLIAEVTHKAIGVGVEVGYTAALGREIIYIRRKNSAVSTTVSGLASHTIVYETPTDLGQQLRLLWTKKEQKE